MIELLWLVQFEITAVVKREKRTIVRSQTHPSPSQGERERANLRPRFPPPLSTPPPLKDNPNTKPPSRTLSKLTRRRQEARKREKTHQLSIMRNSAAVGIQPTQQQQQHHIMPPGHQTPVP